MLQYLLNMLTPKRMNPDENITRAGKIMTWAICISQGWASVPKAHELKTKNMSKVSSGVPLFLSFRNSHSCNPSAAVRNSNVELASTEAIRRGETPCPVNSTCHTTAANASRGELPPTARKLDSAKSHQGWLHSVFGAGSSSPKTVLMAGHKSDPIVHNMEKKVTVEETPGWSHMAGTALLSCISVHTSTVHGSKQSQYPAFTNRNSERLTFRNACSVRPLPLKKIWARAAMGVNTSTVHMLGADSAFAATTPRRHSRCKAVSVFVLWGVLCVHDCMLKGYRSGVHIWLYIKKTVSSSYLTFIHVLLF